jgi:hypothetical protein
MNNKHQPLVGFVGKMGSGKSECGKHLNRFFDFYQLHPATPMRDMLRPFLRSFDIPDDMHYKYLEGPLKREPIPGIGKSGTELQQSLGTKWGRESVSEDVWWKIQGRIYNRLKGTNQCQGFYSDSIRFLSEAKFMRERGGKLVRVVRPDFFADVAPEVANHISETEQELIEVDATIYNDGDLSQLHENLRQTMANLFVHS